MNLKQVIALTFAYYNRGQTCQDAVLEMYASDLKDLDPGLVSAGYEQYRRNPANRSFPLPAQIRELVCPEQFVSAEVQAREIAGRIVGAISMFGWNNGNAAKMYIGPAGWATVERNGGWSHLCQNTGVTIQPTTLQAQLRDQIEGSLKHGELALDAAIKALPKPNGKLAEIIKLASKKQDPPEGA